MTLPMAILTFLNVWWITLFFVLALSAKPETSASPLDYAAAPRAIRWKKKLWLNTGVSVVITLMIALVIKSGMITLKSI